MALVLRGGSPPSNNNKHSSRGGGSGRDSERQQQQQQQQQQSSNKQRRPPHHRRFRVPRIPSSIGGLLCFLAAAAGVVVAAVALVRAALFSGSSRINNTNISFGDDTTINDRERALLMGPCAINLYGLPRSFGALVLPSLVHNVIVPNARHHCDYYVHYHDRIDDPPGRDGRGGSVRPSEILKLEAAVRTVAAGGAATQHYDPIVAFTRDTEETFLQKRGKLLEMLHTYRDDDPTAITTASSHGNGNGELLYMPWKHPDYSNATVDNVIKMWHGQQAVWDLMLTTGQQLLQSTTTTTATTSHLGQQRKHYSRVAMLRCDVVYVTPIDVYKVPAPRNKFLGGRRRRNNKPTTFWDVDNEYAVVPDFANHPVNDRLVYGPHDAVRIWAAGRFERLDRHLRLVILGRPDHRGDGIHSERFLACTIFPAIRDAGITIVADTGLCFLRARADRSIRFDDCGREHITDRNQKAVEEIVGRKCRRNDTAEGGRIVHLECTSNATIINNDSSTSRASVDEPRLTWQ